MQPHSACRLANPIYRMRKFVLAGASLYVIAFGFGLRDLSFTVGIRRITGWTLGWSGGPVIASVESGYEVLRPRDQIVTLQGRKPRPLDLSLRLLEDLRPGDAYTREIRRAGELRQTDLTVTAVPSPGKLPLGGILLFESLAFFRLRDGFGWQRPELETARAGGLAAQLTAFFFLRLVLNQAAGWPKFPLQALPFCPRSTEPPCVSMRLDTAEGPASSRRGTDQQLLRTFPRGFADYQVPSLGSQQTFPGGRVKQPRRLGWQF